MKNRSWGLVLLIMMAFNQINAQQQHSIFMNQGNIYEVNIRQYTKEGTLKAFAKHLPRLQKMGVQTLWFMPLQPISKVDRKGSLGSYYSVASYTEVNPEFGTLADFNSIVEKAHALGMKVLIDWVPNHSGADHPWLKNHIDFYERDSTGKAIYTADWSDTRELNYNNPIMRDSMVATMQYWVNKTKIDGFRVDVAWGVPHDFWVDCIAKLKKMRTMYFLAEADDAQMHVDGFDATYSWTEFHVLNDIAAGKANVKTLDTVLNKIESNFIPGAHRLYFTSNHDENSWNKADYETLPGLKHAPFAVFTQTYHRTMPLIYSGQEEPVLRPIAFFEKDSMGFNQYARAPFYSALLHLRKSNKAFAEGAQFQRLRVDHPSEVMAYERINGKDRVVVVLNLSDIAHEVLIQGTSIGNYQELFTKEKASNLQLIQLPAWGYKVYVQQNK